MTIVGYYRLIVTHRIMLKDIGLKSVVDLIVEEGSGTILLVGDHQVYGIRIDECYGIWDCLKFKCGYDGLIVGAGLLKTDLQFNYNELIRTRKT